MTPPYTPKHNGVAYRANRTITEMVRYMLFDAGLGQEFWGYAARTVVHIINRLPGSIYNNRTPYEIGFQVRPSINHLRIFGCTAYRYVPAQTRRKLDRRSQKCRFIEYVEASRSRVYRLYDEEAKQVYISWDVVFDEESTYPNNLPLNGSDTSQREAEKERVTGKTDYPLISDTPTQQVRNSVTHSELGIGEKEANIGEPLPPIDPEENENPEPEYDQEVIVVKPPQPSARQNEDLPARLPPIH